MSKRHFFGSNQKAEAVVSVGELSGQPLSKFGKNKNSDRKITTKNAKGSKKTAIGDFDNIFIFSQISLPFL